jgi:early secretory antigenic target protein ESAT-6
MSDYVHVQFDALSGGQAGIKTTLGQLNSTLADLESGLQPMLSQWSGAAQAAYSQAKKQWDDAAADLAEVLDAIGRSVGNAHDNYVAAEQAAQSAWT